MHAVFIQNPASIYDDVHGQWYNFPKQYLGMVTETVGDWVVFYEGKRGAFARMVRRSYGGRCAISGLRLRNGGGRAEVQACHIKPVTDGGPDVVRNGIALSGTLHWMFDRGLIRVADDHSLLISHNKVDLPTVERLVNPAMRLMLDDVDPRHHPHPDYLRWHREQDYD